MEHFERKYGIEALRDNPNDLNRLNYLAALLLGKDEDELTKINAVIEHHEAEITSVDHLIDIVLHINEYQHVPNVFDNAALGQHRLANANYSEETSQLVLDEYAGDYRALGRDIAREEKGSHTVSGYVSKRESRPGDRLTVEYHLDPRDYILLEIEEESEPKGNSNFPYFYLSSFMMIENHGAISDSWKFLDLIGLVSYEVGLAKRIHHAVWQEPKDEE